MRAKPERVVFLLFHLDPVVDEIGNENVAAEKKRMVLLQGSDCAA
jgi:hypothetical protein